MTFSLLTYNVLYNRAYTMMDQILEKFKPDIVCLQEIDTSENNLKIMEKKGYRLSDYSNSFIQFGRIFGVATFYNKDKLHFIESNIIDLPRSIYEFLSILLRGGKRRTALKTDFIFLNSKKQITIYNIHLSLYGINNIRIKQIKKTLADIKSSERESIILTGDFNYFPYRRKILENVMKKYGFLEATNKINYTITYSSDGKLEKYNFIQNIARILIRKFLGGRLKADFTFYKNLKHLKTERVDTKFSDHFPIISTLEI